MGRKGLGLVAAGIAVASATLGALSARPALAASGDSNASTPIVFVHGFDPFGSGDDCNMWNNMTSFLRSNGGFTGPFVTAKYYYNDANCSVDLNNYGTQSAYYSSGLVNGQDSNTTDIRHIAYQLAWYIYNTYSSNGQNIGIVAHSMGGLITRYALYRVAAGDSNFPPSLLVSNIVNFGSPHNGTTSASSCSFNNIECAEMVPNSAFLNDLNANGQNPQAVGGTDWTLMGSDFDSVVSDASATSMTANHKVQYASSNFIGHLDYYNKTSTTMNAALSASDNGGPYVSTTAGEWPVLRAQKALSSPNY
jgi:triacylglycerol esterase/lipase EstA (alpha/beta hydrolase family)